MRRRLLVLTCLLAVTACSTSGRTSVGTPGPTRSNASPTGASTTAAPTRAHAAYARWRLPFAISREAVVADPARPGSVVLAGGMLPGDASSARAIELDPATGRTQPLRSLLTPVHDTAGGLFDGRPAVFGGGNATEQSVVQVLTGTGWRRPTHLPTTRSDLSVVGVAGATLVIGGYDGAATPRDVLRVDDAGGRLVQAGVLSQGVRYAATAVVGSRVYVFGGEVDHRELDAVQELDTTTGRTRIVARLPHALGHASAASVDGRILLIGGRTAPGTATDAMWWFDPARGTFARAGRLPAPTTDAAVVASGRRIWLLGGESPDVTDRVVVVDVS